jgi:hypothetical protein
MLRKKEVYTTITPIPSFIPRQLAIDILHSHSEVITLNPLVIGHKAIPAPRDAAADEYYSTWYEIQERIQWVPGMGRMGSGKISFNGCFHDMPWGLQTHILAPMNVDLRNKYRIEGNQPGIEPPAAQMEMGLAALGTPSDGLYLREDIEIRCNIAVVGYVKTQLKAASKEMVARIIKKAELLDSGVLHAMFDNGKLRTFNPNDRSSSPLSPTGPPSPSFQALPLGASPRMSVQSAYQSYQPPGSPLPVGLRPSTAGSISGGHHHYPHHHHQQQQPPQYTQQFPPSQPPVMGTMSFPAEMAGDTYYRPANQPAAPHSPDAIQRPPQQGPFRVSNMNMPVNHLSQRSGGQPSPNFHGGFSSDLAVHREAREEEQNADRPAASPTTSSKGPPLPPKTLYTYNPQDYSPGNLVQ